MPSQHPISDTQRAFHTLWQQLVDNNTWKHNFFSFRKTSSRQSCQWKCNFPNLPISDLLSASDKLESCFRESPFRNRSSGSQLITFYSLRWPVIKKQTNSNLCHEKPWSLLIKYEQNLSCGQTGRLRRRLTSWRCDWRCGQTDWQTAAKTGRH